MSSSGRVIAKLPTYSRQGTLLNRGSGTTTNGTGTGAPKHTSLARAQQLDADLEYQPSRIQTDMDYKYTSRNMVPSRFSSSSSSSAASFSGSSSNSSSGTSTGNNGVRASLKRSAQALGDENVHVVEKKRDLDASLASERPAKYRAAVDARGTRVALPTFSTGAVAVPPQKTSMSATTVTATRPVLGNLANRTAAQRPESSLGRVAAPSPAPTSYPASEARQLRSLASSRDASRESSRRTSNTNENLGGIGTNVRAGAGPVITSATKSRGLKRTLDNVVETTALQTRLQPLVSSTAVNANTLGSARSLIPRVSSPPRAKHSSVENPVRQRRRKTLTESAKVEQETKVALIRQPSADAARRFSDRSSLGSLAAIEVDPLMAPEYADEIYSYWRELELKLQPDAAYMARQPELSWDMRSTLVNWMVQVHGRFKLLPETLFLSVNMLDRFLSCRPVILSKFQLVGISALFIACKFEEIYFPSINDFVYACDNIYTVDEIRRAERYMLGGLHWELGSPGPLNFLRRLTRADNFDARIRVLSKYLLETTLIDNRFVGVRTSGLVAAAVWLARKMIHWEEVKKRRESGTSTNSQDPSRDSGVGFEIEWVSSRALAISKKLIVKPNSDAVAFSHTRLPSTFSCRATTPKASLFPLLRLCWIVLPSPKTTQPSLKSTTTWRNTMASATLSGGGASPTDLPQAEDDEGLFWQKCGIHEIPTPTPRSTSKSRVGLCCVFRQCEVVFKRSEAHKWRRQAPRHPASSDANYDHHSENDVKVSLGEDVLLDGWVMKESRCTRKVVLAHLKYLLRRIGKKALVNASFSTALHRVGSLHIISLKTRKSKVYEGKAKKRRKVRM